MPDVHRLKQFTLWMLEELARAQQTRYTGNCSRKIGHLSSVQVISKLGGVIFQIWNHINATLHKIEATHQLNGLELPQEWMEKEYKQLE